MSPGEPFPSYHVQAKNLTQAKKGSERLRSVNAQMLQQVLRQLEVTWEAWLKKRSGLPRFKNAVRMRSFVFPQMLRNCISAEGIRLPQLGFVKVRWSRQIPELFQVKQARIVRKASGYFVLLSLQADVDIPEVGFHGHPLGVDVGFYGKVAPRRTSQECSDCGAEVSKDLSVRVHQCSSCGSTKPRDIASAQVICTRGQRGIENVCEVEVAGAPGRVSSQLAVKQKIFGSDPKNFHPYPLGLSG